MFPVICIDDTHKPNDIPASQWIVKGKEYFVIQVCKMNIQEGLLGFKLAEVNLDGCTPYEYYAASRFGITKKQLDKLLSEKSRLHRALNSARTPLRNPRSVSSLRYQSSTSTPPQ